MPNALDFNVCSSCGRIPFGLHFCRTSDQLAHARAASKLVADESLAQENRDLHHALELANDALEQQQADLETCRVQRDAASAVADLAAQLVERLLGKGEGNIDIDPIETAIRHYWAVTKPEQEAGE